MQGLLMKIGASMVTAVAGGTTWLIVEPGMRDRVAQFTGLDLPGTEAAAPASTPEPLDLARHPDAAPSFNCDDATRTIEHLICSDPAIAEADVSLGRVWSTLKSRGLVDDELRMSQRQWLAKRDACLIDDDPKTCVKRSMLDRIGELSAL